MSPTWVSPAQIAPRECPRGIAASTALQTPEGIVRKVEDKASAWNSISGGQGVLGGSTGHTHPPGQDPAQGFGSSSSPGCARSACLFPCISASRSTLSSWLFRKLQQSRCSWGREGACDHSGPRHQAAWLAGGHQGPDGMKRDLVLRLQHETEGMRRGESMALGNPRFQVWLCYRVVVWPWQRSQLYDKPSAV